MLRIVRVLIPSLCLLFALTRTSLADTYMSASVTVVGAESQINGQWDSGSYTVSWGTYSETVPYGQFSTASSIASAIAAKFSRSPLASKLCPQGICAKANGATVVFYVASSVITGAITTSSTPSFSGNWTPWVSLIATVTTLTSSTNPVGSGVGGLVTFTATVTPNLATGTITFFRGSIALGNVTISNGSASLNVSVDSGQGPLWFGDNSMTAQYRGDNNYDPSLSTILDEQVISGSITTLTSSLNPSIWNQKVTLTAVVTTPSGYPLNGIVSIYNKDNGQLITSGAVSSNGGFANTTEYVYSTENLSPGMNHLYASFLSTFWLPYGYGLAGSTSSILTQTVYDPVINSITPSSGLPGDQPIIIRGTGFTSTGKLYFGGQQIMPSEISTWTDTEIHFKVPAPPTPNSPVYAVYVSVDIAQSNGVAFTMGSSSSSCPY